MTVFSPFPLSLAFIMYGRLKGVLIATLGLGACIAATKLINGDFVLVGFYLSVILFAVGISEIVRRSLPPVKGLVILGVSYILLVAGGFGALMKSLDTTPKAFIVQMLEKSAERIELEKKNIEKSGGEGSIEVLQLLDRPDLLADVMIQSFPSYFIMGVFLILWFNMFLVLKSRRLLFSGNDYLHDEKVLLNFKVPFGFVIVLVLGLVLAVWGNQLSGAPLESIGMLIITTLGVFYFFQGFGVFSELLNFAGLVGFFRTLVVMITIFTASYLVALAGLLDNWFDFRKYLKKRKTED